MSRRELPTVVVLESCTAVTGGLRCAQRMASLLKSDARFVLVLPPAAEIAAAELAPFHRVERLPVATLRRSVRSVLGYGPALASGGARLKALLERHGASTLVVNDFFLLQGWMARRLGWRGRIVTWVRFDPWRFPHLLARLWLSAAGQASDAVVAVSRFIEGRLPSTLRPMLLYDCLDPALPTAGRAAAGTSDIVYIANYIPGKGQNHALKAFAQIAPRFRQARLRFFGGDMGLEKNRLYRDELKQRAAALGLTERVEFNGFTNDLASVLSRAALAVNLSESESFSLTCLEAQQHGLPVVAFRSGGPEEIIVDGVTGLLLPLGDVDGVATAMAQLLGDEGVRRRLGDAAAAHVRRAFAAEAFVAVLKPLLLPQAGKAEHGP